MVFFTGTVAVPDGWLDAARHADRCVLYRGLTGLFDNPHDTAAHLAGFAHATGAGLLAAAGIQFRELSSVDAAAIEPAQARPGATGPAKTATAAAEPARQRTRSPPFGVW